jgi:putative flippase GtrA
MVNQDLFRRVVRFCVVGSTVMVFCVSLNWLFGHWMGKQAAFLLAYPPTLALHFSLNKRWTFGCERTDMARQIGEYLVMVVVTFVIQWTVFTALTAWTPIPGWLAAAAANAAQMLVTFVAMQRKVFAGLPQ